MLKIAQSGLSSSLISKGAHAMPVLSAAARKTGQNRWQNGHHDATNRTARVPLFLNNSPLKSSGFSSVFHNQGARTCVPLSTYRRISQILVTGLGAERQNSRVDPISLHSTPLLSRARPAILQCDHEVREFPLRAEFERENILRNMLSAVVDRRVCVRSDFPHGLPPIAIAFDISELAAGYSHFSNL
jgi:hypothetical protein